MKYHTEARVDMLEKLPAPFGLVRYGVAPDHPEVKNVIRTFTQVAKNPRFQYWGNITVGRDLRLAELRAAYDAVLLAYGASLDRRMNIAGEDLKGVISAKQLVGWYNGYPNGDKFTPDLDCERVAIVGMGNVALDVARILLSPLERLQGTDIPEPVMDVLSKSRVREVSIVGRRGPLHSAFSLKEVRELANLKGGSGRNLLLTFAPPNVFEETLGAESQHGTLLSSLPRARRRLTEFLLSAEKASQQRLAAALPPAICEFRYLRSALRVHPRVSSQQTHTLSSNVAALELTANRLEGEPSESQIAVSDVSKPREVIECGLVIRSIGQQSLQIDEDLPFHQAEGRIACIDEAGRVDVSTAIGRLYASGWAKRGAVGLLIDTAVDARLTAEAMLRDQAERKNPTPGLEGFSAIRRLLEQRCVKVISFREWERVDCAERSAGEPMGKPREKMTSIEAILKTAFKEVRLSRCPDR